MAIVPGQCGTCTTPAVALFLETVLPGEFTLTGYGSGQWVDTPLSLVLPEAGDWRVTADVRGQVNVSLSGNGATASLTTFITTTGPATLAVQACRVYGGTNPVARLDSDGNGRTTLTAERVR